MAAKKGKIAPMLTTSAKDENIVKISNKKKCIFLWLERKDQSLFIKKKKGLLDIYFLRYRFRPIVIPIINLRR